MATLINKGWLYVSNGTDIMKLACLKVTYDLIFNPTISHNLGGINYGYDLSELYAMFKVTRLIFNTEADRSTFISNIISWQQTAPFTFKIQRNTSGNYEKLDGTNTSVLVLIDKGLKNIEKITPGDQERYVINDVLFVQAGDFSA